MRLKIRPAACAALTIALSAVSARAWFPKGHTIIARAAVLSLPADVPAFFRQGGGLIGHTAQDPDVDKVRETPNVNDVEYPEHFLDYELLKGKPLPATRSAFVKQCTGAGVQPKDVGFVPYAVAEWTERLAVAFAEHRKWPGNPYIPVKAQVYAGFLAHYAGDLCMPLHTTVDYDGRVGADGKSPHSGIHAAVDSLIERLDLQPADLAKGQAVHPVGALMPAIVQEIDRSRALIDTVYRLQPQLPPSRGEWTPSTEVTAFTKERARAATRFLGSLYLTAWRRSAAIHLPPWLERESGKTLRK